MKKSSMTLVLMLSALLFVSASDDRGVSSAERLVNDFYTAMENANSCLKNNDLFCMERNLDEANDIARETYGKGIPFINNTENRCWQTAMRVEAYKYGAFDFALREAEIQLRKIKNNEELRERPSRDDEDYERLQTVPLERIKSNEEKLWKLRVLRDSYYRELKTAFRHVPGDRVGCDWQVASDIASEVDSKIRYLEILLKGPARF